MCTPAFCRRLCCGHNCAAVLREGQLGDHGSVSFHRNKLQVKYFILDKDKKPGLGESENSSSKTPCSLHLIVSDQLQQTTKRLLNPKYLVVSSLQV